MMLKDFTLFIPVRDRHYNLRNICNYYKDLNCIKLIVDSSESKFDDIDLIKSCGFEYVYYGPMLYINKMNKVYKEIIETEIVLDCSDDDIVVKNSIKKCVEFLKENKDYTACDGEWLWLDKKQKHIFCKHPNKFFGPLKENFSSPIAKERVSFEFNCCMSKQHSVIRRSVALKTWDILKNYPPLQPLAFIERFHVFVTAIMGNSKKLPLVYSIRNSSSDRMLQRSYIRDEMQADITFIDNLDHEHLKPFVDLLLESDSTLTYLETYNFVEKLLRDELGGTADLCHVNTDGWSRRINWAEEQQQYNTEIEEVISQW